MSETTYVIDSSVALATLFEEPRTEAFDIQLNAALIGAVNLAEIVTKLQDRGIADDMILVALGQLQLTIEPFDEEQAVLAGKLRSTTRSKGLSLGDRACIALAAIRGATVVTTDRAWAELDLPVPVLLIR